jgi:hypothetical protein
MAVVNGTDFLLKVRQASTLGATTDPGRREHRQRHGHERPAARPGSRRRGRSRASSPAALASVCSASRAPSQASSAMPWSARHSPPTHRLHDQRRRRGVHRRRQLPDRGDGRRVRHRRRDESLSKKGDTDEQNFPTFGGTKYVVPGIRNVAYTVGGFLETSDVGQQTLRDHELVKAKVVLQVLFDGTNGFQHEARPRSFSTTPTPTAGSSRSRSTSQGESATATSIGTGPIF